MSTPAAAAKIVRNTVANGIGGVVGVLVGLALTPFMIAQLGLAGYGVWTLALTLTFAGGYASLSDLGIEGATVRYVAEAMSDNDVDAVSRIVSSTLAFFCAVGVVLAPVVVALAHPLVGLFGVPHHLRSAAALCFLLVGAQLVIEIPMRAFVAVLEGTQEFVTYQVVELGRSLLQAALFVVVLLAGWGVAALGGALLVSSGVILVVYWWLVRRAVPGLRVSPLRATRAEIRRLIRFGGETFTLRLVSTIYRQMDKAIVGIALGPSAVGLYEIANKVNLSAATISSVSVSAVVPAAASSRRDASALRDMFLRGSCYSVATSLPFAVAAFVLAEPLLHAWIGPQAVDAVTGARLFLAYEALQLFNNVASTMMFGLGRLRLLLLVNGVATLANLGLSIVLVKPVGFEGVIIATLIANGIAWPVLVRFYLSVFDESAANWFKRIVRPNLPGFALQAATAVPLLALAERTDSLALLVPIFAVSVAVSLLAFLIAGIRGEERRALRDTVLRAAGRKPGEMPA